MTKAEQIMEKVAISNKLIIRAHSRADALAEEAAKGLNKILDKPYDEQLKLMDNFVKNDKHERYFWNALRERGLAARTHLKN